MSTTGAQGATPSLSVEQLVALNDELEALVRAGIPLERGLAGAARDYRGQLGRVFGDLGRRLDAGESLPTALAQLGAGIPTVYRSIIEAGLRTGRLADALQGLTRIGMGVIEARRTITLACFYPLLVLILAYLQFLVFLVVLLPRFNTLFADFDFPDSPMAANMGQIGESVIYWGPTLPLVLIVLLVVWRRTGRSRALDGNDRLGGWVGWFPWVGRIIANYRSAHFTDLLAHLVEHEVPLDQALILAGDASGSPTLRDAANQVAARLEAGDLPATRPVSGSGEFPPLIAWMVSSGHRQGGLVAGLRHLATSYRRKADRQAETFRVILPGLLILVIGSGGVLAYGLLLFLPLRDLWHGLAGP